VCTRRGVALTRITRTHHCGRSHRAIVSSCPPKCRLGIRHCRGLPWAALQRDGTGWRRRRTFSIALSAMAPHAAVRTPLLPKSLAMLRATLLAAAAVAGVVTWRRRGLNLPPRFVPKAISTPVKQLPPALRPTEDVAAEDSDARASASASAPSTSAPSDALEADAASKPAAAAAAARAPLVQWPDDRGGDATPAAPRVGQDPPPLSDETQVGVVHLSQSPGGDARLPRSIELGGRAVGGQGAAASS